MARNPAVHFRAINVVVPGELKSGFARHRGRTGFPILFLSFLATSTCFQFLRQNQFRLRRCCSCNLAFLFQKRIKVQILQWCTTV